MSPSSDPPRVICVGIAVLDRIYHMRALPSGPGKRFATSCLEAGGGPAASAAVTVARLGGSVALWSRVGDDPAGRVILDGLVEEGVDVTCVRRCPGAHSVTASVLVDDAGERSIITHLDPALPADPSWLPLAMLSKAGCVLSDCRWPEAAATVLRTAAVAGIPSVLDADAVPDPARARILLALATHVIFSAPGLAQATGVATPEEGLRAASAFAPGWLAVTLGAEGALSLEGQHARRWPAYPVAVVDTTGAGDVFHGAFALALAEQQPLAEAMRFAAAAAALKCARPGGRAGIPARDHLVKLLREEN